MNIDDENEEEIDFFSSFNKKHQFENNQTVNTEQIKNNILSHNSKTDFYDIVKTAVKTDSINKLLLNIRKNLEISDYFQKANEIPNETDVIFKNCIFDRNFHEFNENDFDEDNTTTSNEEFKPITPNKKDDDVIMGDSNLNQMNSKSKEKKIQEKKQPCFLSEFISPYKQNNVNPSVRRTIKTDFYLNIFNEGFDIKKKTGYINDICSNPNDYYPEKIEELSYSDVEDYFREAIPYLKKDGTYIKDSYNQTEVETPCDCGSECWAYREFGIVLRKFRNYKFCICCIREVVYNQFQYNITSKMCFESIQPHYYVVDKPGIYKNGKYYKNYSSRYMICQRKNSPFLGIYQAFPTHYKDRFYDKKIKIKKDIKIDNNTTKSIFCMGIREKDEFFFLNEVYSMHNIKFETSNIKYKFKIPCPIENFINHIDKIVRYQLKENDKNLTKFPNYDLLMMNNSFNSSNDSFKNITPKSKFLISNRLVEFYILSPWLKIIKSLPNHKKTIYKVIKRYFISELNGLMMEKAKKRRRNKKKREKKNKKKEKINENAKDSNSYNDLMINEDIIEEKEEDPEFVNKILLRLDEYIERYEKFEEILMNLCFKNNFKLPLSLKLSDYYELLNNDFHIKEMVMEKNVLKKFSKDYEDELMNISMFGIQDTSNLSESLQPNLSISGVGSNFPFTNYNIGRSSTPTSASNFTAITMSVVGQKKDRKINKEKNKIRNKIHEKRKNTLFLYWLPKNVDIVHIKEFFWFFVRINTLLHLIKNFQEYTILIKYLEQIYEYSIPYMLKIEKYYYNKKKINGILKEYCNNFNLRYEFSYKNMEYMKNERNKFGVKKNKFKKEITEFDIVYQILLNKSHPCIKKDDLEKIKNPPINEKETIITLLEKFKFFDQLTPNITPNTIEGILNTHKSTFITFFLLSKYKLLKEDFKFSNVYSLISLLFYLIKKKYPSDKELNKDIYTYLKFYPVSFKKEKVFDDIFSENILFYALINKNEQPIPTIPIIPTIPTIPIIPIISTISPNLDEKHTKKNEDNMNIDTNKNSTIRFNYNKLFNKSSRKKKIKGRKKKNKKKKINALKTSQNNTPSMTLKQRVIRILSHTMPQHCIIRSFEKNLKRFYFEDPKFAFYIDNMIICSFVGLYEKWTNINSIFKNNFLKCIKTLLNFYSEFVIHLRDPTRVKTRFQYIEKNFLSTKYMKIIIQEFITYLFFRDTKIIHHIKWNVISNKKNNNLKLDLTLRNFIYCGIKNSNLLRDKFYGVKNSKYKDFLDTRRKKKPVDLPNLIMSSMKILKEEEYFICTIFNFQLPVKFEFIYEFKKMKDVFGKNWKELIDEFWNLFPINIILNPYLFGWSLYLKKNFKLKNKDLYLIKSLFLKNNKHLTTTKNYHIQETIYCLSYRGRSLLYYLFDYYIHKKEFIQYYHLSINETIYQLIIQKFNNQRFLDFGVSNCSKKVKVHNSQKNLGYEKISITEKGMIKYGKKNKSKMPNEIEKYNYYMNESKKYINDFVQNTLFINIEDFKYYKKMIYSDVFYNRDFDNVNCVYKNKVMERIQNSTGFKSFAEMLSNSQLYEMTEDFKKNSKKGVGKLKNKSMRFNNLIDKVGRIKKGGKSNRGKSNGLILKDVDFEWPRNENRIQCRRTFLKNLRNVNKMACFLRKMCKWVTGWRRGLHNDKRIHFYPPIGLFFVIKTKKSNNIMFSTYKLCIVCGKVKEFNEDKQFDFYKYCCKDCEKLEDVEPFEKILLIDSEEEYMLFNSITK